MKSVPSRHLLVHSQQSKHQSNVENLFKESVQRRQWRRSGLFTFNFEQILYIVLVFPLLTLNK